MSEKQTEKREPEYKKEARNIARSIMKQLGFDIDSVPERLTIFVQNEDGTTETIYK